MARRSIGPWHVEKRGKKFAVVNMQTGNVIPGGVHATRAQALDQLRALYANVPGARAAAQRMHGKRKK